MNGVPARPPSSSRSTSVGRDRAYGRRCRRRRRWCRPGPCRRPRGTPRRSSRRRAGRARARAARRPDRPRSPGLVGRLAGSSAPRRNARTEPPLRVGVRADRSPALHRPANRSVSSPSGPGAAGPALGDAVELGAPRPVADVVGQGEERAVHRDLRAVGAQRVELLLDVGVAVDGRGDVVVGRGHRQRAVGVHARRTTSVSPASRSARSPLAHPALRHRRPVDLGDLPRLTEVVAVRRHRGQLRGVHRDAVGLDVVGVAVACRTGRR